MFPYDDRETEEGRILALHLRDRRGARLRYRSQLRLRKDAIGRTGEPEWPASQGMTLLDGETVRRHRAGLTGRRDGAACPIAGPSPGLGSHGENITFGGLPAGTLGQGTRIRIGKKVLLEVTHRGRDCRQQCPWVDENVDCPVPDAFLFADVLRGGTVRPGDPVRLC